VLLWWQLRVGSCLEGCAVWLVRGRFLWRFWW
jgi:hypothetical protein